MQRILWRFLQDTSLIIFETAESDECSMNKEGGILLEPVLCGHYISILSGI